MPTTLDSPSALAALLRPALFRLTRRVRVQRVDTSLTLTQLAAVNTLALHGPMSARELAEAERVQPPSMTKVVAVLVDRGFVERQPHPSDGRQVILQITAVGTEMLERERRSRDAWLSRQLEVLDDDERALLARVVPVLDKLAQQ